MNGILARLGEIGVVPVVVIEDAAAAVPLARALVAGGLPCAEITFRTPAAEASIRDIAAEVPDLLLGAGTILSVPQAEVAVRAGAKFIVSPGFDVAVVDWCVANHVPVMPGVMTPTEINMALNKGLDILKFFPAEAAGGIATLKAISAAYRDVKFVPTGGIIPANLPDYLRLPTVHACGGSWLVAETLISAGAFDRITALAAESAGLVTQIRAAATQIANP